jgi:hypothetical protein
LYLSGWKFYGASDVEQLTRCVGSVASSDVHSFCFSALKNVKCTPSLPDYINMARVDLDDLRMHKRPSNNSFWMGYKAEKVVKIAFSAGKTGPCTLVHPYFPGEDSNSSRASRRIGIQLHRDDHILTTARLAHLLGSTKVHGDYYNQCILFSTMSADIKGIIFVYLFSHKY